MIFRVAAQADLHSTKTTPSPSTIKKRQIIDLTIDDQPETITHKRARREVLEDTDDVLPKIIRKPRHGLLENTSNDSSKATFRNASHGVLENAEDDLSRPFSQNAQEVLEDSEDDLSSLVHKPTKTRQEVQGGLSRGFRGVRHEDTEGGLFRSSRNESGKTHSRPSNPPDDGVRVVIPVKRHNKSRGTFFPLTALATTSTRDHIHFNIFTVIFKMARLYYPVAVLINEA